MITAADRQCRRTPERSSGNHLCSTKRHYHIRVHARRWNFLDRNVRCNARKHRARDGLERAKRGRCHLPCRRSDGFLNCVPRSCEEIPLNQNAWKKRYIYIHSFINCYSPWILFIVFLFIKLQLFHVKRSSRNGLSRKGLVRDKSACSTTEGFEKSKSIKLS